MKLNGKLLVNFHGRSTVTIRQLPDEPSSLKPSGHYMYRQFNIQQLYVLPHTAVFMCFVWISEQTAIISLYNIN